MKKTIFFILSLFLFCTQYTGAATRLILPEDAEYEELNKDQKYKFQSVDYGDNLGTPNQYKGKLNFETKRDDFLWKEGRLYFGAGGRYSLINNVKIKSNKSVAEVNSLYPTTTLFYNQSSDWEMKKDFNYFASIGFYWTNGLRVEFEYSQSNIDTENYGYNFPNYTSLSTGVINKFNQYLQTSGKFSYQGTNTLLTNNMIPVAEFAVNTYMINVILEQVNIKSKIRPYVGFGLGVISGSMDNFVNDGDSFAFGGQVMVGLSMPVVQDIAVIYLGYRFVASMEMEQNFKRIIDADDFDGTTYINPVIIDTTEKFRYTSNNLDFGLKFFF